MKFNVLCVILVSNHAISYLAIKLTDIGYIEGILKFYKINLMKNTICKEKFLMRSQTGGKITASIQLQRRI